MKYIVFLSAPKKGNQCAHADAIAKQYGGKHVSGTHGITSTIEFSSVPLGRKAVQKMKDDGLAVRTEDENGQIVKMTIWNNMLQTKGLEGTKAYFSRVHPNFVQPL